MSGGKFVEDMIAEAHGWSDKTVKITTGLNDLRDACYANSKNKGFHDGPGKSVPEDIALMHSELSEALEDFRSGSLPSEVWYTTRDGDPVKSPEAEGEACKPHGIPSEMADVIIRVLDFCGKHKIDIEKAVKEKMAFNATRPHKHGKVL